MRLVVTIDGPAGSGKSTVAGRLADRLGWRLLDTGAMYRAVTLAGLRSGMSLEDDRGLAELAERLVVELTPGRVLLDGEDVSAEIRSVEVTEASRHAADHPRIRARLVGWQRAFAKAHPTVAEGRDQGTVVFPDSPCKFFLTADPRVRAARRYAEMVVRGVATTVEEVLKDQEERDARDLARAIAPLRAATDAHVIDTSELELSEVVDLLESVVRERFDLKNWEAR